MRRQRIVGRLSRKAVGMNKESRIALIVAQAAMLNAEIAMAQAANKERDLKGLNIAYGEGEMYAIIQRYEATLGYNEVILALRD